MGGLEEEAISMAKNIFDVQESHVSSILEMYGSSVTQFKKGKKKYYIFQGSTLQEGIGRRDLVFTHKELQKAAHRTREMKKHIAREFERLTFFPMENVKNRSVLELARVLSYSQQLEKNRRRSTRPRRR